LVVAPGLQPDRWEILSGHRRWACALALGLRQIPCEIRPIQSPLMRQRLVLEYNRQRIKTFSQRMREADLFEGLLRQQARQRRIANLQRSADTRKTSDVGVQTVDCRNSDDHTDPSEEIAAFTSKGVSLGRTDTLIARHLGLGGKDLYRQARAIWQKAQTGDVRAQSGVTQLDAGTKTIHAAYKDLRRRGRFTTDFRPTPYDVWAFRHDRAFGIPYPGSIPPAIVAHALHYFSPPGGLVVDPMAGGGTTLDVCQSMGRRCFAYDLHPARSDILQHDIRTGFPVAAVGCHLIFCDPPYHTMLAHTYGTESVAAVPWQDWITFLYQLAHHAFTTLRPGGYLALLLAAQTEKDLPAGYGYLDHAFCGYTAALRTGFLPVRRISCPMDGHYLPQHVRQARVEGRMLGQVRDLLVVRRPLASE
jgi:ParB family transcriptional regulator, chromosome partitioning protein